MEQQPSARRLPSTHWSKIASASHNRQQKGGEALNRMLTQYQSALLARVSFKFRSTEDAAQGLLRSFLVGKIPANELLAQANTARYMVSVGLRL